MSVSVNVENTFLEQYKVSELREELRKKGLSQKGVKKELVKRLEEAIRKEGQFEMLRSNLVASEDGQLGSTNSDEEAESDHEGKIEASAESVIPDHVDSAMQNQELAQAAGIIDAGDASPVARDTLPVFTNFTEEPPQDESKNGFASESNYITQLELNKENLDISDSQVQTEVTREKEGPHVCDDIVKAFCIHAPDINKGKSSETDSRISTLDAYISKENLEGNQGLSSLESGESHVHSSNAKIADDNRESIVESPKLEAVDGEKAYQIQDTATDSMDIDNYQHFSELHKLQNYKEGAVSQVNICPVSEVKQEMHYRSMDDSKFQTGFVMFRDEVKNANSEPLSLQKGVEQAYGVGVDQALAEQKRMKSFYKDEQCGQYGEMLEGTGTSAKSPELKVPEHIPGLQEYKAESLYKPMESTLQAFSGQKRKGGGLNEDMIENSYILMEPAYSGQERNEEEIEARQQEPVKRQRRWNSGNKLIAEPVKALITDTVKEMTAADDTEISSFISPSMATPKIVAMSQPAPIPVKADPLANGDRERQRIVPPARRPATTSLRIDRFVRPLTLKAVKDLLSETGTFTEFWMDQIKTHCYVTYSTVADAIATRNALYNLQWPVSFGNVLTVEFVDPEEVTMRCEGETKKSATSYGSARAVLPPPPPLPVLPVPSILPDRPPPPPPLPLRERAIPMPVKEPEPNLDDLFKKTKAKPHIYYLPLTDEQVAVKIAAKKRELQL